PMTICIKYEIDFIRCFFITYIYNTFFHLTILYAKLKSYLQFVSYKNTRFHPHIKTLSLLSSSRLRQISFQFLDSLASFTSVSTFFINLLGALITTSVPISTLFLSLKRSIPATDISAAI